MKYLVDATVLSEATRPTPNPGVLDWLRLHQAELAIDPIILGEISFGIRVLSAGRRRQRLEQWFEEGVSLIVCLPWDAATGVRSAGLLAELRVSGRQMPIKDSLIAATASVHALTVVTRNTRDFEMAWVDVVDPFA